MITFTHHACNRYLYHSVTPLPIQLRCSIPGPKMKPFCSFRRPRAGLSLPVQGRKRFAASLGRTGRAPVLAQRFGVDNGCWCWLGGSDLEPLPWKRVWSYQKWCIEMVVLVRKFEAQQPWLVFWPRFWWDFDSFCCSGVTVVSFSFQHPKNLDDTDWTASSPCSMVLLLVRTPEVTLNATQRILW